jgi:hypothetical protein
MRLWKFVLCMVIVAVLSIWGCAAIIDTPEAPPVSEVSFNSIIYPDNVNKPIEYLS